MLKEGQVYKYEKNKFEIYKIEDDWIFVKDIPYKNFNSKNVIRGSFFRNMVKLGAYQLQEKKK